jgi:hypothetical protein
MEVLQTSALPLGYAAAISILSQPLPIDALFFHWAWEIVVIDSDHMTGRTIAVCWLGAFSGLGSSAPGKPLL